jgi:L-alanine-DL-glutamate epimerase-like enolase superfamily enzyme
VRIEAFRTFVVHDGYRSFVFLKLYAEDGLTGVGEGTVEWNELAAEACLRQTCARIRGADPFDTEALGERLYRDSYWRNDLIIASAISAIDQACWDLEGKKLAQAPWIEEVVEGGPRVVAGEIAVPERPGLGVELHEAAALAHPFREYWGGKTLFSEGWQARLPDADALARDRDPSAP